MKIAIVTGGSSGMGKQMVMNLPKMESFDEIWVISRNAERFGANDSMGIKVRPVSLDLTDSDSLKRYSELLSEERPNVTLLANCSGFGKFGSYEQIPLEDSLNMIDLNCKALVAVTELTLPYMKKGARIMELDSLSAFQPVPYLNVYAATKAFVMSYSRSLGRELKSRGIRVMALCPGWVRTPFFDRAQTTSDSAVTYFNVVYSPEFVIERALHDLYRTKKDVCVPGFKVRMQVLLVKILPHRLVMDIWLRQQGHNK